MNLRQLEYFVEIAQLQSFTRASEVLHVAQSALSRQIRMLEDEVGAPLFNRFDRGVTLTETGELLRDRATALLAQLHGLRDEVTALAGEPRGELEVGVPPSMREMVTVPLVDAYCRRHGAVRLHVHEGISIDLAQLVQEARLDCAVIVDLAPVTAVKTQPLVREQLYLVGPRTAKLRVEQPVPLAAATRQPLILTTRPNSLRLVVEKAFAREGLPLSLVADSNSTQMMIDLAARRLAYTILPYCAIAEGLRRRKLSAAPIEGLFIEWVLAHPAARGLSLAAERYRDLLYEVAREQIRSRAWIGAELLEPPEG
jgi:LysR family nitrogen assimilation transcriptional regulator